MLCTLSNGFFPTTLEVGNTECHCVLESFGGSGRCLGCYDRISQTGCLNINTISHSSGGCRVQDHGKDPLPSLYIVFVLLYGGN